MHATISVTTLLLQFTPQSLKSEQQDNSKESDYGTFTLWITGFLDFVHRLVSKKELDILKNGPVPVVS